jgi:glycosyltransferase involved in cell wall biosynthesis
MLLSGFEDSPPAIQFDPGFSAWHTDAASKDQEKPPQCLVLGRTEDVEQKGLDIAARAIAVLPSVRQYPQPVLIIRGAEPRPEDALEEQLRNASGVRGAWLRVNRYTTDPDTLKADLRRTSLLMMPSRSEGFGLVGLEALGAGVPVLISAQSGLGELLLSLLGADSKDVVIPVSGDLDRDGPVWSEAIHRVLSDRQGASEQTRNLQARLQSEFSWKAAVEGLMSGIVASEERILGERIRWW